MAPIADPRPAVPPPKPFWKRVKRRLRGTLPGRAVALVQYACFRAALALAARIPAGWTDAVGGALGFLARLAMRRARRTAEANLRAAASHAAAPPAPLPTAAAVFRHFGIAALETARFARALDREGPAVLDRWVAGEGLAAVHNALAAGRGAILVAPHLGNWELLVLWLARQGLPLDAIGRPIENARIDAWVRRLRTSTGMTLLDKKGALRAAVHSLRAGRLLLVLPDQYGGSTGVPARFFGAPVSAPGIVGALAARLGAPVLAASCTRTGPERYRVRCRAIDLPAGAGAEVVTQAAFDALEDEVRAAPEQWLWMHGLWRRSAGQAGIPEKKPRSAYRRLKRVLKNADLWRHVQVAQYLAFRVLVALLQAIPSRSAPGFARAVAFALPWLCRRERRVFERNMDLVFGSRFVPAARLRALRRVFESFILVAHDTFLFPRRVRRDRLAHHFEIEGLEHVDRALAEGKGIIFVLGHLGNWELASLHMAALGYPMFGIFAERTNARIDDWLTRLRMSTGAEVLMREGALKQAIRGLQRNRCLSLVIDLDAGDTGAFVDFFGVPASTMTTSATLARRTGAPLIPFSSVRVGPLRYRNRFHPPIGVGPADADPDVLQRATDVLAQAIRATPEQWAWIGNRWKTRP